MIAASRCALGCDARRFYDDPLVSPWKEDGALSIYAVSDKLPPSESKLQLRVMDFQDKITQKLHPITVPERSSKIYSSFSRDFHSVEGAEHRRAEHHGCS